MKVTTEPTPRCTLKQITEKDDDDISCLSFFLLKREAAGWGWCVIPLFDEANHHTTHCAITHSIIMASNSDPKNPGNVLASAVDAEVAKYREMQESIQRLRGDLQTVLGQATENEMVLNELELMEEGETVYKMIGPALIKQDLEDAVSTVKKRLEFIHAEEKKIDGQIKTKEAQAAELAQKVEQMNATLQQTTAQAVQAIAAEHQKKSA